MQLKLSQISYSQVHEACIVLVSLCSCKLINNGWKSATMTVMENIDSVNVLTSPVPKYCDS